MSETSKLIKKLIVSGSGTKKAEAFASALNKIQGQMLKETNDVLLRIEPIDVKIIEAAATSYTERFLFFFLPRKSLTYDVKLAVTVELTVIDLTDVNFKLLTGQQPDKISNPFKKKKENLKEEYVK